MSTFEELVDAVIPLAQQISALHKEALRQYEPLVDRIVRSDSRDVKHIEQVLDGLLDFGSDEACLQLYKRLCRHYWTIDKVATAECVMSYRKMWVEEDAMQPAIEDATP